jgi:hypothetical protein
MWQNAELNAPKRWNFGYLKQLVPSTEKETY